MRQVLSTLVEILSGLGLRFGHLRQAQRAFARLAHETDAVAAQLAGGQAGEADRSALVERLRAVARDTEEAVAQSAADLDGIRDGMLRATGLAANIAGDIMRAAACAGPDADEPPAAAGAGDQAPEDAPSPGPPLSTAAQRAAAIEWGGFDQARGARAG